MFRLGVGFIFKTKSQNARKSYNFSAYNKWDILLIIRIFPLPQRGSEKKKQNKKKNRNLQNVCAYYIKTIE